MENISIKINEVVKVDFIDLSYEGLGVAKIDGFAIFVAGALPGERASVRITKVEKRYAYGTLLELLITSDDRVEVENNYLDNTIPLQHLSYEKQLAFKSKIVKDIFKKNDLFKDVTINDAIGANDIWHYRNKTQVPVYSNNKKMETGVFVGGSKNMVAVDDFKINLTGMDEVVVGVRDILAEFGEKPYDNRSNTGNIRHIIVRKGYYTNEIMIIIVTRSKSLFPKSKIIPAILEKFTNVVSIVHNINNRRTSAVLGDKTEVIYGNATYEEKILGKVFDVNALSFMQVNTQQSEVVYKELLDSLDLNGSEIVLDAYCGIGTISLQLADKAKQVIGIESIQDAVEMANANAAKNNISNAEFICGNVEDVVSTLDVTPNVVVVDPPRKGLDSAFVDYLVKINPTKIAYVSCNPATLVRDVTRFVESGYTISTVQPIDMFPQTVHVETVVLMSRKDD